MVFEDFFVFSYAVLLRSSLTQFSYAVLLRCSLTMFSYAVLLMSFLSEFIRHLLFLCWIYLAVIYAFIALLRQLVIFHFQYFYLKIWQLHNCWELGYTNPINIFLTGCKLKFLVRKLIKRTRNPIKNLLLFLPVKIWNRTHLGATIQTVMLTYLKFHPLWGLKYSTA